MIFSLIGSLGLFLLGMWMMTEGLKMAGGRALETLLGQWTSSRQRGLLSGIMITGLVQSSSAVTVATIGFVNAGILTFPQALWVVFGSNVGTTLTAWIVTLFGFSVNIDSITFPLIGVGAALRIYWPNERGKAFGMAIAGFGLLFMGIDALKENFSGYATQIDIAGILSGSNIQILWGIGIGFLLTLLTQSSSAAIAIILTAVASEVAGVEVAAAAVIGANVGTTFTALIASLGATDNAKRLAWAHVAFNILTAVVALALLPLFWIFAITDMSISGSKLTVLLAIFHTFFNALGILLMWPIEPKLSRFLLKLYQKPIEQTQSQSQSHLDANIATIPDLAVRALTLELNSLIQSMGELPFLTTDKQQTKFAQQNDLKERIDEISNFISLALKSKLTEQQGDLLTAGISVSHYLQNALNSYSETAVQCDTIQQVPSNALALLNSWLNDVEDSNLMILHSDEVLQNEKLSELLEKYQLLKNQLLASAVREKTDLHTIDTALQAASLSRRFIEQLSQANSIYRNLVAETTNHQSPTDSDDQNLPPISSIQDKTE